MTIHSFSNQPIKAQNESDLQKIEQQHTTNLASKHTQETVAPFFPLKNENTMPSSQHQIEVWNAKPSDTTHAAIAPLLVAQALSQALKGLM